jgi:hypothetical protein
MPSQTAARHPNSQLAAAIAVAGALHRRAGQWIRLSAKIQMLVHDRCLFTATATVACGATGRCPQMKSRRHSTETVLAVPVVALTVPSRKLKKTDVFNQIDKPRKMQRLPSAGS